MLIYPFINLFLFTLASRTLIALSASHWLIVWGALEINIISFIPLITSSSWAQESESALKYLLFQALGSRLILVNVLTTNTSIFVVCGLLIKIGAAPFHFWFPSLIKSLPWPSASLLLTWQKIAPLRVFLFSVNCSRQLLCCLGALGALIGGFGGLAQSHFRPLLAYSSIGHMGWIIAGATFSPNIAGIYFLLYIIFSVPILWASYLGNISSINSYSLPPINKIFFLIVLPCILSLGGLPPLAGFFPKLIIILSYPSTLIPLLLIVGSLINLRFYLSFFFSWLLSSSSFKIQPHNPSSPFGLRFFSWITCFPIPILFIFLFTLV